jgi:hypothetical protein
MCPIFGRLWSYDRFFHSRTRPRVNRVCHHSVLVISTLERYLRRAGKGGVGWIHNRAAACVATGGGMFENQL